MAHLQIPPPGKLIVSYIYASMDALAESLKRLERQFGPVEFETIDIPCTSQDRYGEEMGEGLNRRFFSFEKSVPRDALPALKKITSKVEPHYADIVGETLFRSVNIDPGILSPDNLVMASTRAYNHRPYLTDGIYTDLQLVWSRGQFVQLPWTNQDFCHDEAIDLFERVRETFDLVDDAYQVKA